MRGSLTQLVQRLNFNKGKRYRQNERKMDRQEKKEWWKMRERGWGTVEEVKEREIWIHDYNPNDESNYKNQNTVGYFLLQNYINIHLESVWSHYNRVASSDKRDVDWWGHLKTACTLLIQLTEKKTWSFSVKQLPSVFRLAPACQK